MSKIILIDPMTLVGRETLAELGERAFRFDEVSLYHTSDIEEHQVTAAGGSAMLVSRIRASDDLAGADIIVLCSAAEHESLDFLDRVLEAEPDLLFVDASQIARYRHLGIPLAAGRVVPTERRLRLADPSLVMTARLLEALDAFRYSSISLTSVQPASALGEDGIETLARQSASRLRGENLPNGERVLAFNMQAVDPAELRRDAALLFPGVELTVSLVTGSCFHGHLLHLGLSLEESVNIDEVEVSLRASELLRRVDFPVDLNEVPDRQQVLVAEVQLSDDGKQLLLQAMADGSRVGGAMILADLLESGV